MTDAGIRAATLADLPALGSADETGIEGSGRWVELGDLLTRGWGLLAEDLSEHWRVSGILEGLDDGDPEIVFSRRAPS